MDQSKINTLWAEAHAAYQAARRPAGGFAEAIDRKHNAGRRDGLITALAIVTTLPEETVYLSLVELDTAEHEQHLADVSP